MTHPCRPGLSRALAAGLLALGLAGLAPAAARASHQQVAIIQDRDPAQTPDPAATMQQFRALGAGTVRVMVNWYELSRQPSARQTPAGFDPSNPADYAASAWAPYDATVQAAGADGLGVDFTLAGGAPRWAEAAGIPPQGYDPYFAWKPNAHLYGEFVRAVGTRYSGHYVPPGASGPLPAVHFWALWNEPNFGEDLAPQAVNGSRVSAAPSMYRNLLDAGYAALRATGHGGDRILIGELAAEGDSGPVTRKHPQGLPGYYSQTRPELFVHTLYCVDAADHRLRGAAARAVSCPATAAGSRTFRADNPGLFSATGFADHPYPGGRTPTAHPADPGFVTFPQLQTFAHTLDRLVGVYGSRKRFAIYNTEFGYITRPPEIAPYVSPATAARYLNWTEYLSWRNPRVASYMQYLLRDPTPQGGKPGFASGLFTSSGQPKATYYAYRMPVYLPRTTLRRGRAAEVWGGARPAAFMARDTGAAQTVAIQWQAAGRGAFQTLRTVTAARAGGYFDVRMSFPGSGTLRLAYTFPPADALLPTGQAGTTIYSRSVTIRVR